ncbi:MAG: PEGA domain-containing protein [Bryobacteraceae bacterium]|nr:PEGA domain-containing protein [Solibacteraceae bacterium]MCO5352451.1 PEGA domain-containing protein [Bryobacteraceae bacterium]
MDSDSLNPDQIRQEKSRLYLAALDAFDQGRPADALAQMDRWAELDQQAPETPGEQLNAIQRFHQQARDEAQALRATQNNIRQLIAFGQAQQAQAICDEVLTRYPQDPVLIELKAQANAEVAGPSAPASPPPPPVAATPAPPSREQDAALLRRFLEKGVLVTQGSTEERILKAAGDVALRHPADSEIQSLAQQIRVAFGGQAQAPAPPVPTPPPAASVPPAPELPAPPAFPDLFGAPPDAPAASVSTTPSAKPFEAPDEPPPLPPLPQPVGSAPTPPVPPPTGFPDFLEAAPPPPPVPPKPAPKPAPKPGPKPSLPGSIGQSPKLRYGLIAAGVLILLLGIVAIARKALAPSDPGAVQVSIQTTPPGATIRIGGENKGLSNLSLALPPGDYQAEASLEGYEPATTRFRVEAGQPFNVQLTLDPWRPVFRLYSESEEGSATLAGRALTAGPSGDAFLEGIEDGDYELRYTSRGGEAGATVRFAGSGVPSLAEPPTVKNLVLILVHQRGETAVVYASAAGASAGIDGRDPEPIPPEGRSFTQLTPGSHTLSVEDGKMVRTIPLQTGGAPTVNAYIFAPPAADKGSLLLLAGVDGAEVTLNGRRHWQLTRNGQVRVGSLGPGTYQVRVSREGYEPAGPQRVEVLAGEETRIELPLKPVARVATLQIAGPAGAQVFVDGSEVGTIDAGGSFSTPVSPGSHTIELRRGSARSRPVTRSFTAGETWRPPASELALAQPDGTVRFDINPASATLLLRRQGEPESQGRPVKGPTLTLAEGSYILVAAAPGYTSSQVVFAVQPGTTVNVPLRLSAAAVEVAKPKVSTFGMADFDEPNEWDMQNGWAVRRGGNYATYSRTPTSGVFTFTVQLRRGKRVQWFLNHKDDRNHILFRIDRNNFYRLMVINGRTNELAKVDHGLKNPNTFEMRITVSATSIRHEIRRNGEWAILDDWRDVGASPVAGKFGFYIPGGKFLTGSDEYALKDFVFSPR